MVPNAVVSLAGHASDGCVRIGGASRNAVRTPSLARPANKKLALRTANPLRRGVAGSSRSVPKRDYFSVPVSALAILRCSFSFGSLPVANSLSSALFASLLALVYSAIAIS